MPDEEIPQTSNASNSQASEISHISIKLPPIWRKNIKVWFVRVEAQFATANITREITKFNHVIASLDCDVAEMISDILSRPTSGTPYTDLKNRLIQEFEESER